MLSEYVTTGFTSLDKAFGGGFQRKHVYVVLGPPGSGKTAFLKQLLAANEGVPGIIAYELENCIVPGELGETPKVRSHLMKVLQNKVVRSDKVAIITCPTNRELRRTTPIVSAPASMLYRASGVIELKKNPDTGRTIVDITKNRYFRTIGMSQIEMGFIKGGVVEICNNDVSYHPYSREKEAL